jgi:uncharacterized membrane protein YbhN (UPF0104 family)
MGRASPDAAADPSPPALAAGFRRRRVAIVVSSLIAGGTAAAIAASDRPRALLHALEQMQPLWLLAAFGVELISYVGYVLAYRATVLPSSRTQLSLGLTVRLVVAGFGPFVPLGGFSFDREALAAVHRSRRQARRQVLALGVIEYLLLAPAAAVCALLLLLESDRASPALTLPWVFGVPIGFTIAWWATQPHVIEWLEDTHGRVGTAVAEVLHGAQVLRRVVLRPLERPLALVGMAVYWAAEIACLGLALLAFGVEIGVPQLIVAYSTGYAASRRSLPLGGAGITEALLTVSLIAVHVHAAHALVAVVAYRVVNFLAPIPAGLVAHSSLSEMLEEGDAGAG